MINKEKKKVLAFCQVSLRDEELAAESKSTNLIREFLSLRKHKMNEFESLGDNQALEIDDYENFLTEAVTTLEDKLMEIEMHLQDALSESTDKFRDKVHSLNGDMKNKTMDFMKFVMEESENFHTTLKNFALVEQAAFETEISAEEFEIPETGNDPEFDAKFEVLAEKEPCIGFLDAFKEYMDQQVGQMESKIIKSITNEWDAIYKNLTTN